MPCKTALEDFFDRHAENYLTVACSREIDEESSHISFNINYQRCYIQEFLQDFNVGEWTENSEGLYILVCGNKNALGSTVLQSLNLGSAGDVEQLKASGRILMELWNE